MLVLVCGMPRSGSTLSYNFVREALRRRGSVTEVSAFALSDALAGPGATHIVNKAHAVDDLTVNLIRCGAIRAVCTIRRPEDAVVSWHRTFGFSLEQSIDSMRWWFRLFQRIRDVALTIDFETIERYPALAAWRVGRYVTQDYGIMEALGVAAAYRKSRVRRMTDSMRATDPDVVDLGRTFHDRTTMFHRLHISSTTAKPAPGIAQQIRRELSEWVDENGNIRGYQEKPNVRQ